MKIMVTGADGALGGLDKVPQASAYAATKPAVVNLMKTIARERQKTGIGAYTSPGITDTPANRTARPDSDFLRWTSPEQLAETAIFLMSETTKDLSESVIWATGRLRTQ